MDVKEARQLLKETEEMEFLVGKTITGVVSLGYKLVLYTDDPNVVAVVTAQERGRSSLDRSSVQRQTPEVHQLLREARTNLDYWAQLKVVTEACYKAACDAAQSQEKGEQG